MTNEKDNNGGLPNMPEMREQFYAAITRLGDQAANENRGRSERWARP